MPRRKGVRLQLTPEVEALIRELQDRNDVQVREIPAVYTAEELAELLKVNIRTVGRWTADHLIEHVKVGDEGGKSAVRYLAPAISAFLRRFTVKANEPNF